MDALDLVHETRQAIDDSPGDGTEDDSTEPDAAEGRRSVLNELKSDLVRLFCDVGVG